MLIKIDPNGNGEWGDRYGGSSWDGGNSVQQTSDGGYIIAGYTFSYGAGECDIYLVKTDPDGYWVWDASFGGTGTDQAASVQQTSDGGYIIAGYTFSYGAGECDVLLIKTDPYGYEMWNASFGGSSSDGAYAVQQTSDGGYIITGFTSSYGIGGTDVWLIKTDPNGNEIWNRTFGGEADDEAFSVQQTSDEGYIIAGYTSSYGSGESDILIIKTDPNGDLTWDTIIGGSSLDEGKSVRQTSDGGYVVAGHTYSDGSGENDILLIKTDPNGNTIWQRTFGGSLWDEANSVQQTSDGGYVIAGYTYSYSEGGDDAWIIKLHNEPPRADVSGPYEGDEGSAITFDAGNSSDPEGDILQFRWDFDNDGTWDTEWSASSTASHTWYDDWKGTITVEVSDGTLTKTGKADVTVKNKTPIVDAIEDQTVYRGREFRLALAEVTDLGILDTHTATIDWADGSAIELVDVIDGMVYAGHVYSNKGTHIVKVIVIDDDGAEGSDTLTITVEKKDESPPFWLQSDYQLWLAPFQNSYLQLLLQKIRNPSPHFQRYLSYKTYYAQYIYNTQFQPSYFQLYQDRDFTALSYNTQLNPLYIQQHEDVYSPYYQRRQFFNLKQPDSFELMYQIWPIWLF